MPKVEIPFLKRFSSGLTTISDVDSHIRKTLSSLTRNINLAVHEIGDIAEVKKVYTKIEDLPPDGDTDNPNFKYMNAIEFNIIGKEALSKNVERIALPINNAEYELPVEGEYVVVKQLFGKYFYGNRINIFGNPNNSSFSTLSDSLTTNSLSLKSDKTLEVADSGVVENKTESDITLGNHFKSDFTIKPILLNEGDSVVQGRFGNTIRLGSNIESNIENSPNIKLRAGQLQDADKFGQEETADKLKTSFREIPVVEDINSDASSIWMTTDETVSLTPATLEDTNIYPTEVAPAEFSGKQIILNSGRLIFNSKENGILGFSNGPIDFSTLNTFGVAAKLRLDLYSPTITVGRRDKTKNINLNTSNVTVRGDSGKTLVRANKIRLLGPVEGEDIRRAGKLQPVIRDGVVVAPGGKDIQVTPAVKGDELKEVLKEMLEMQKVTTKAVQDIDAKVLTPLLTAITPLVAGATAAPLQAVAESLANITMNVISDINTKIETLPKILSKVVEIE